MPPSITSLPTLTPHGCGLPSRLPLGPEAQIQGAEALLCTGRGGEQAVARPSVVRRPKQHVSEILRASIGGGDLLPGSLHSVRWPIASTFPRHVCEVLIHLSLLRHGSVRGQPLRRILQTSICSRRDSTGYGAPRRRRHSHATPRTGPWSTPPPATSSACGVAHRIIPCC
jgi:hypothetical protein